MITARNIFLIDLGAAALERRPSIRKINELGLFDLVAAMA
jgi:hypothetical protein